ncbi:hypothetical protein BBJ28_00012748 [Nothophytophthora sp. Chile5]|nr:hypothetical protein BBJ28_00012748 [Nothophytophthora sp. Chile5]
MDPNVPIFLVLGVFLLGRDAALSVYSLIFMRFAWMVKPRNYLLLVCHASNETAQLYQLQRGLRFQANKKAEEKAKSA